MIRIFVNKNNLQSKKLLLSKEDFNHLNVLRIKPSTQIELLVIDQKLLLIKVLSLNKTVLTFTLISQKALPQQPQPQITLAQCLPKQEKFTDILKKCTELGVSTFIPVINSRTIPKITTEKSKHKIQRWQKIIKESSEQSKRYYLPNLSPPMPFTEFLDHAKNKDYNLKIVLWEESSSSQNSLKTILNTAKKSDKILVFVGPEGGISAAEIEDLLKINFRTASLGPSILRTENAGFLACGNIMYELNGSL
ncbi:16S rRNA (uracil(1498)-N(3))-methyltransferase [bacterium]|jgi:16S rRNA (uracil1498-N3)-methyltransferase|nr:16S rRNA (uracil(1498)-N(3))-methyltransferase [bacterium]MBT3580672.1 16S rRNA (uracil(1498)-N(3))-methyltransferase [bacterium]MBT4552207.1 16S rRNA (uracil(1498)-N(3))-methyltransferase [bacterium]MBT5988783.1 16S rRNA (uracil(1498)-N(3))-methyltransferase [bacterium]MBT7087738.1 16S rRNA (uracil(1498)-N(3))-methyltransferase [bacterium]